VKSTASKAQRRYAAFLRGVSPMNANMAELKACFESAGFRDVKTVLSSGNVVFGARAASETAVEKRAEKAMRQRLSTPFRAIVRPVDELEKILESDPFAAFRLSPASKRVVTFLRKAPVARISLPREIEGARILAVKERTVFTCYLPNPRGAVFMSVIEKTFGKDVTTRTWQTVKTVVAAAKAAPVESRDGRKIAVGRILVGH
jgi:uncharacterized protein (DUF1697 family)